jgi:hypothetical protein
MIRSLSIAGYVKQKTLILMSILYLSESLKVTALATSTFYYMGDETFSFEIRPRTLIQGVLSSVLSQNYVWILLFRRQNRYIYCIQNSANVENSAARSSEMAASTCMLLMQCAVMLL